MWNSRQLKIAIIQCNYCLYNFLFITLDVCALVLLVLMAWLALPTEVKCRINFVIVCRLSGGNAHTAMAANSDAISLCRIRTSVQYPLLMSRN